MSAGSSANGGNGGPSGGRRPFFNDRRFTVAGPQRLRQNVQDLLSQFNRQFAVDNPHLLHELADQLNRLQDLLGSNANGNAAVVGTPNQAEDVNAANDQLNRTTNGTNQPNSPGDNIAAEFENVIDRLGNAEGQYLSDGEEQDEDIGTPNRQAARVANDSVILNMEINNDGNIRVEGIVPVEPGQQPNTEQGQEPQQGQAAGPNGDAEWQRLVATLRAPEMQRIIRTVQNFGPFLFILLAKWILTYAAGMVMLFSFIGAFFYAENVVETVVASSRTQRTPKWRLLSTIFLILFNIAALYFFFEEDHLYLALAFQPTMPLLEDKIGGVSFLTLLWLVTTTDLVAKFMVILAKCLVVSGPALVATHRRKAHTYQWLEYTSHIYRHWLPTLPWSYYLTHMGPGSGFVHSGFCTILFLLYLVLKVKLFSPKLTRWWQSTLSLVRPTSFGFSPSTLELMKTGPTCSICYAEYTNPVQLTCKHIFCEECVTTWLDKQKTCPMCRTQVITGDNDWKDGKTSYCIQFV